jgi:hypothetical protein
MLRQPVIGQDVERPTQQTGPVPETHRIPILTPALNGQPGRFALRPRQIFSARRRLPALAGVAAIGGCVGVPIVAGLETADERDDFGRCDAQLIREGPLAAAWFRPTSRMTPA